MNSITSPYPTSIKPLAFWICGLAALFYFYEFCLQVSPNVMTSQLMQYFQVDASGLGLVSAFYYYSYTLMQVPAGLLFDRYGARALLTIMSLVCALGALCFSFAAHIPLAAFGRLLMGGGSAFAFIGVLYLVLRWFPPHLFALFAGVAQLMGSAGAVGGEAPLASAVLQYGWQPTMRSLFYGGAVLAALIFLFVRDTPKESHDTPVVNQATPQLGFRQSFMKVVALQQNWMVALYNFFIWAPIVTFAGLWGVPALQSMYDINEITAANACSMVWIGTAVGSPIVGWLSDKIRLRCAPLYLCALLGVISTLLTVYLPQLPIALLFLVLFLVGFAASGQSLSFGVVKDINHPAVSSTAIGFTNMAVVAGGAVFQPLAGYLLDFNWDGKLFHGVPMYTVGNYQLALSLLPLCYLGSFIVGKWFLKETHCEVSY